MASAAVLPFVRPVAEERPRRLILVRGDGSTSVPVALAARQPLVRAGLRALLEHEQRISVVGEASTGEEALELALRMGDRGVVLIDVCLPGLDCVEVTRRIRARGAVQVVLVAASVGDDHIDAALRAGARGVVFRDSPPADLVRAVLYAGRDNRSRDARRPSVSEIGRTSGRASLRLIAGQALYGRAGGPGAVAVAASTRPQP
jgi:CheY-like chemotaxis protein